MRFEEYRKHDAVSLAELIAKREVSAKEVLETAIARAEQVNLPLTRLCTSKTIKHSGLSPRGFPKGH